jgi:DnaJ homolog subfamily C member 19
MPVLIGIIIVALGWAYWTGKLRLQQLPPVVLGIAGGFLTIKGAFIPGIIAIGIAATWYRGLTWRLFGLNSQQSEQYHIDKARYLLGVGSRDDADRIRARHRKLIAENHPDIGGNDERASALNEARDLLLKALAKDQ